MSESSIAERNTACGRLLCDTYYGAKVYNYNIYITKYLILQKQYK